MSSIFISHSSHDSSAASQLMQRLRQQGYKSLFLDFHPENGIPAGKDWERELYRQLSQSSAILALCSEESMKSPWCFAEIALARMLRKYVFVLRIDGCAFDGVCRDKQRIDLAEGEAAYDRLWRGLRAAGLDPRDDFGGWSPQQSPYPGLEAFDERHAAVYCGRRDEIHGALDKLRTMQLQLHPSPRLALVVGSSGCGKSSFVKAGLIPRLRKDEIVRWIVVGPFRPRDAPLDQLSCALRDAFPNGWHPDKVRQRLEEDEAALTDYATDLCGRFGGGEATVLLVLDQLEEALRAGSTDQAAQFRHLLKHALSKPCHMLVLGTIRHDFLERLQDAMPEVKRELIELGPISTRGLEQVIQEPGEKAGVIFQQGLVARMSNDASKPHALPLLGLKLEDMYRHEIEAGRAWGDRQFTFEGYGNGLEGIVQDRVRSITGDPGAPGLMEQLGPCFLKMVDIDEDRPGAPFTRKAAGWDEFTESERNRLQGFVDGRLLVSHEEQVEPVHECLFWVWEELEVWLSKYRDFLLWRKRARQDKNRWYNAGRPRSYLLHGGALIEAKKWMDTLPEKLDEPVRRYVKKSLWRAAIQRWLVRGTVLAAFLALSTAALYAWNQKAFAEDRRQIMLEAVRDMRASANVLVKQRDKVKQASDAYQTSLQILQRVHDLGDQSDEIREQLAETLTSLAWAALVDRRPDFALRYALQAKEYAPTRTEILLNVAHAYLFDTTRPNSFDTARKIYEYNKNKMFTHEKKTFDAEMHRDFQRFRDWGIADAQVRERIGKIEGAAKNDRVASPPLGQ